MSGWQPECGPSALTEIPIAALEVPSVIDEEKVMRYALMLDRLPPVVIFDIGGDLLVVDGYHRINAARRLGRPTVKAQVWRGTRDDALAFAAHTLAAERGITVDAALRFIKWHMARVAERCPEP